MPVSLVDKVLVSWRLDVERQSSLEALTSVFLVWALRPDFVVLSRTIMSPSEPSARPNENAVTSEGDTYYRSTGAVLTCIKWQKMMVITNSFQTLNTGHCWWAGLELRDGMLDTQCLEINKQGRSLKAENASSLWTKEKMVVVPTQNSSKVSIYKVCGC